ncbi:MAG: hypothetical protein KC457_07480 [Myxococcales bacterium]|nr:hypothetical protein [Myxococcales bacterium]
MNKLSSTLVPLLLAAPALLATSLLPTPVQASTCTLGTYESKINGGRERTRGVPNYDQASFSPGVGDCSPTAVAMVLGYWDANGWSCLYPGTGPYYSAGNTPHPSIAGAVDYFKINLAYSSGFGTWHTPFHPWAGEIADYVAQQDPGAAAWSVYDDFYLTDWDMTSEIDAQRPVVISVFGVSGKQFSWDSPYNPSLSLRSLNHSMAALSYRRVVQGAWFFGCQDWLAADEFYVGVRSGWQEGGDSQLFYHWGIFDLRSAVKVQPAGSPTCSGGVIQPCPYTNDGECDEPEGLGWCDEGTDVADCTCVWRYDGECDEPQGTGVCPAFSDAADC